ncbi:hypothetical protein Tco_0154582 [Tanacetum coccineum]
MPFASQLFPDSLCARYQARPIPRSHTQEFMCVCLRYLRQPYNIGLWYLKDSGFELIAYSDADHAGCKDGCKSTLGGLQFIVIGAYKTTKTWLQVNQTFPMDCDSKYVVAKGTVEVYFVGIEYQLADLFTKALPKECFEYLVHRIAMETLCKLFSKCLTNVLLDGGSTAIPRRKQMMYCFVNNISCGLCGRRTARAERLYFLLLIQLLRFLIQGDIKESWHCKFHIGMITERDEAHGAFRCMRRFLSSKMDIQFIHQLRSTTVDKSDGDLTRQCTMISHKQQDIAIWLALQMKFERLQVPQTTCRTSVVRTRNQDDPYDDAHPEGENSANPAKKDDLSMKHCVGESSSEKSMKRKRGPSTSEEETSDRCVGVHVENATICCGEVNPHGAQRKSVVSYYVGREEDAECRERVRGSARCVQEVARSVGDGCTRGGMGDGCGRRRTADYKNLNKNDIEDIYLLIINGKVPDYAETGLLWSLSVFIRSLVIWERSTEGFKELHNEFNYGMYKRTTHDEVEYLKLFEEEIETLADKAILSGADNHPPMLEKDMYDSWKSIMTQFKLALAVQSRKQLSFSKVLTPEVYALVSNSLKSPRTFGEKEFNLLMQGTSLDDRRKMMMTYTPGASGSNSGEQRTVICYNYKGEGHMSKQCTKPKRKRDDLWFKDKVLLVQAQANGQILHVEEQAFLADPGIAEGQATQTIITHNMLTAETSVNDTLTAELERYKEQVKVLKEGQNVDLKSNDNVLDSSAQSIKIGHLKQTLSEHFNTSAIVDSDSEETLMLAEESRSKMLLKQKDPIMLEKKVNTTPVDYAVLNQLSQDFEKRFVPQTELSAEQAFWSQNSVNSPEPTLSSRPTKVEVPKELPKVSMVNTSLKKLKHHLAGFDVVVKERTTPTAITEGSWGFEHIKACFRDEIIPFVKALKDLFNTFNQYLVDELSEVQNVFHQMEQAVEQHRLESKTFEVKMNQVLNENERLLEQVINKDIVNVIMNSSTNIAFVNVHECEKCLKLETELQTDFIEKEIYDKLFKSFITLEKHCISLEVDSQLNQEIFQRDNSVSNQSAPSFDQLFELNELKA